MKKRIVSCIMAITMLMLVSVVAYAETDDELRASNEIEFFVTEADGSWWNVIYPANGTIGDKYLNEVIEGVQLSGIRVDKVGEFRYQLIPETQEQKNLICGYETVDDATFHATGIRQRHKLQAFLQEVDSPTANERIEAEKKQAEEKKQADRTELGKKSTNRWADIINSYIYDNGDNTFNVVDYSNNEITINTYSNNDYALLDTKSVSFELEKFGGFYAGNNYNFLVFGQANSAENDNAEVVRVVRYTKDWERLDSVGLYGANTTVPFEAGSLHMTQYGDMLYIRTCHEMYAASDGRNHQANLTFCVNIPQMEITDQYSEVMNVEYGYVSHSFNQFILIDEKSIVAVDHGDAHPRSIVLIKYPNKAGETTFTGKCEHTNLFEIPGAVGANCTGVTVGGFEYSDNNYLVAINKTDHSKITEYTSYEMKGLDYDERDIVLLVSSKNNTDTSKVKQVRLTDYIGKQLFGSKPYLVKLSNDRFLVLWEELEYITPTKRDGNKVTYVTKTEYSTHEETTNSGPTKCTSKGVKYVLVNGNGEIISDIRTRNDITLSNDCQPVRIGDNLTWYINGTDERKFYNLDLNSALITVKVNGQLINFDQPPTIIDGRTLVPVRAIFEALGATVDWNDDTQTVISKKGSTNISLTIDSNTMYKDGKAVTLDVPAQLISDRTLVPARAVAEAFGCSVDWDNDTKTVIIND